MTQTLPERFARLRIMVAFLGQADTAGWWTSSFLSPNGLAVAQYNFPRAARYAAMNATTAAAKRLHDERIGKRRCVHLFRLALGDEILIQQALQHQGGDLLKSIPKRREDAMKVLASEGGEVITVDPGPVQIGTATDAFTETGFVELAKHYLASFRQDIQCLPYFANSRR